MDPSWYEEDAGYGVLLIVVVVAAVWIIAVVVEACK